MNTLLHELGHVIGLRHEFALDMISDATEIFVGDRSSKQFGNSHNDD